MNSPISSNQESNEGHEDDRNVETTLLLPRPIENSENDSLSSSALTASRRRLWPDIRHYDTIDMAHLIVNAGDDQPTAAVYEAYSYSPTLNDYHDLFSQRLSFAHDRDDTLLILGNNESSLLDLEGGRPQELLAVSNQSAQAIQSPTLESNTTATAVPLSSSQGPNPPDNGVTGGTEDQTDYVMDTVNRLRCIFSCVTLPIVPIGSVLSMTLFYVIYAAFVLDVHQICSQPLKLYTIYSTALFLYIPQHKNVKMFLFRYNRERDGPQAPMGVKVYDQLFYLVCLIYLSGGIDLVQSCVEDVVKTDSTALGVGGYLSSTINGGDFNNKTQGGISSCSVTCPHLYAATKLYVTILQLFAFAMLLPIVFLPCIYAYIIRRVHRGVESILLQSILRRATGGEGFRSDTDDGIEDGVTVQDIMDTLQKVQLVFVKDPNRTDTEMKKVQIIYTCSTESSDTRKHTTLDFKNRGKINDWEDVKDCCICMSDLLVSKDPADSQNEAYVKVSSYDTNMDASSTLLSPLLPAKNDHPCEITDEEQQPKRNPNIGSINDDAIVQTKCGHLFHLTCLGGWIGGSWDDMNQTSSVTNNTHLRRARRRCCPLCREDLTPTSHPQRT